VATWAKGLHTAALFQDHVRPILQRAHEMEQPGATVTAWIEGEMSSHGSHGFCLEHTGFCFASLPLLGLQ